MKKKLVIGSRASRLARIQTQLVARRLKETFPELELEIRTMETTGDRRQDLSLDSLGGKGVFIKELDLALLQGEIDLAVHSLKDMPMEVTPGLGLAVFSQREDPRDALVLPSGKEAWDGRSVIGCSSFRRKLQAEKLFPEARFKDIRGNVPTRLEKLDKGEYDALILAAAGLRRLGLEERIFRCFEPEEMLPAAGQGTLAVTMREEEDRELIRALEAPAACRIAREERAFVQALGGGCSSPVAAYGERKEGMLLLWGLYYDEKSGNYRIGSRKEALEAATGMGAALAEELREAASRQQEPAGRQGE